ncbi:D-galactarate dehydratase [Roseitranquillus sediminis]|uniref:D-galactarate dehydratase n=1 Tax=Roseitranquillus sediminis TaxID=2809051 RepID=UPI001D0BFB8D|nr:D-galactarate dehydratase [Roseitranquillus sediminis]MBM9595343.1 D-galactarate dehydratase [Roseitranquillus sediminis]
MKTHIALAALALLAGCATLSREVAPDVPPRETPPEIARVVAAPSPPPGARTAAQFDTTTAEQRAAATAVDDAAEEELGSVVVSLGDPAQGGLWLRTPLVGAARAGRVVTQAGRSGLVELIPSDGGSRMSLAAMRLLDLPLGGLHTVTVHAR